MTRRQSPTVKQRRVAATLKEFRGHAGISLTDASRQVDRDAGWLSRVERLETRIHPNDVRALLMSYGLEDEAAIEAVVTVARQARQHGWWRRFADDVMPDWFDTYVGLETDASTIRTFETQMVPGLLQTEDYARATFMAAAAPTQQERIDRHVALRIERQALIASEDPPQLRVVLDEAVLHRVIGGPEVMRAQIEHLVKLTEQPHIQILVLPFAAGPHAGLDGAFVILDFPPPPAHYPGAAEDKIVYIDTLLSAIYLDRPDEVSAYTTTFEQIAAYALDPQRSRESLVSIAADLTP